MSAEYAKKSKPSQRTTLQVRRGPIFSLHIKNTTGDEQYRQGFLYRMYQDDIAFMIATDDPAHEPRYFFIKKGLDWKKITDFLLGAWRVGAEVPYSFMAIKRIPDSILDNIQQLAIADRLTTIEALRGAGFLPEIFPLQKGKQPLRLSWDEVPPLCYTVIPS